MSRIAVTSRPQSPFRSVSTIRTRLSSRIADRNAAELLLNEAVLLLSPNNSTPGEQFAINKGWGGAALNAQYGASSSLGIDEPQVLPWSGENYLYLPGTLSNNATIPSSAPLEITGDIEIVARIAADDWTPSSSGPVASKGTSSSTRSWLIYIDTAGHMAMAVYPDGTTATLQASSAVVPATDGSWIWGKWTWRASDGRMQFFTASDQFTEPSVWTQLGVDRIAAIGSIFQSSSTSIEIGSTLSGGGSTFPASFKRVIMRNGIGGTTVLDVDFNTNTQQSSFACTTGQTVTINRTSSGRKSAIVVRPTWLFGSNDYLEVANNALLNFGTLQSATVIANVRQWTTPISNISYVSKLKGLSPFWALYVFGTAVQSASGIGDGTNQAARSGPAFTAGVVTPVGMLLNRTAQTVTTFTGATINSTVSTSAVGDISNSNAMRVCGQSGGTQDVEVFGVYIWLRPLTQAEITLLSTYLV